MPCSFEAVLLCSKAVLRCGAGLARLAGDEETIRKQDERVRAAFSLRPRDI
ncbi:MAG: hypothetical protein Q8O14_08195 [bacterium]|jgi:hypothetical protein|nr:hypothetical protein [bacterium]